MEINKVTQEDLLLESSKKSFLQLHENDDLGIPLNPDVADFMGAFEESAIALEDTEETTISEENYE